MLTIKTYNAILEDMKAWVIANQDKITDFNDGSVILAILGALSQQLEQLYIRARVGFSRSLKNIPYEAFDFTKKLSIKSTGQVKFTRTAPAIVDIQIASGTIISTDAGTEFSTQAGAFIYAGNTESALVAVIAVNGGRDGNVVPGAINQIPSPISGVDSVTNVLATTGGVNEESQYEFELRFKEYIEGLSQSTESGLIFAAKTVPEVRSASFVEHVPALSGIYHGTLYLDDGSGTASNQTVAAVQAVIDGDGTQSNPGYRAAGLKYRILAPTVVMVDITISVDTDGTIDKFVVKEDIEKALTDYVNGLTLGKDVVKNRLIDTIMGVPGVYDQTMTLPVANIAIAENQIARIGTLSVVTV